MHPQLGAGSGARTCTVSTERAIESCLERVDRRDLRIVTASISSWAVLRAHQAGSQCALELMLDGIHLQPMASIRVRMQMALHGWHACSGSVCGGVDLRDAARGSGAALRCHKAGCGSASEGSPTCAATCALKKQMTPIADAAMPAPASCLMSRVTACASARLLDEWLLSCLPCPLQPAWMQCHNQSAVGMLRRTVVHERAQHENLG